MGALPRHMPQGGLMLWRWSAASGLDWAKHEHQSNVRWRRVEAMPFPPLRHRKFPGEKEAQQKHITPPVLCMRVCACHSTLGS